MHRTVFFLPGARGDADFWKPVGDLLPGTWTKKYFNWPGLGHQASHANVREFDDLVRVVEESLGGLPTNLVAQSMGGVIALRVALKHPKQVRRLVLAVTSGGVDVAGLGGVDWRPAYRREFPKAAAWITDPQPTLSHELGSITQPTLLLWGDADPISPVAVGEKLQRLLPCATLRVVAGGDHGLVAERATEVAPLISEHLMAGS
jgi:pimeloyl-ACP methyl ester carboxylesterase